MALVLSTRMSTDRRTRVIVVDDHELVREGLKRIVEAQEDMSVVAEAADAAQAMESIRDHVPDVVLMDVSIHGSSGVTLTLKLSRDHPSVRVIGVSRHNEPAVMDAMLQAGARGYVLKQNASAQLPVGIRAVAGGAKYVDVTIGPIANRHEEEDALPPKQPTAVLSQAEEDVLRLIAFSYTHEQIGERLGMSLDETMNLKLSAMQKAQLSSRVQVMTYARARGWLSKQSYPVPVRSGDPSS